MKISIHSDLFNRFPDLNIAVVVVAGVDNQRENENLQKIIQEKEDNIRADFFLESLYRMVLEGKVLKSVNTLVDIYKYVSLKHMIPLGGNDLDKVEGDVRRQEKEFSF